MSRREPTRHQISSGLTYSQHTPAFLQRLQNRIAGNADEEDAEWEDDGSGRPPIPRRPAIPERPADDPGSADEEDGDEKPVVVVLKEGKHLTEREAENIRRKERGLAPLPHDSHSRHGNETKSEGESRAAVDPVPKSKPKSKPESASLSFSSSKHGTKSTIGKRKAVGNLIELDEDEGGKQKQPKKKVRKNAKMLLSFDDGV